MESTNEKGQANINKPLIKSTNLFPVVGVGASAGGLAAFKKLLKAIPEDSGMAYVLVQHLDPNHQSLLPEILQKVTSIPVLEITADIKVQPNHIYVIPSNKMMVATDGVLVLTPRPAKNKNERNLPIDLFFASLAEVHQTHAIGVVLSGTASDGTQGLKAIKDQGGITIAQEESSAEYDSMPNSAVEAGVVDFVLPPEEIPQKLLDITRKIGVSDEELESLPQQDESVFKQILSLLRIRKGVDFTHYKQTTVRRRILRRMVVNKNEEPSEYLKFLRGNNPEQDLLYQDMLIPVTSFFRDKKVFENLCSQVFPAILKNKIQGEVTRIWVAGCSTGQEVYSFAMCFREFLGEGNERIQIFGTDLSEPAISKARSGIYEKTELDGVSAQRLQDFFTKTNGNYQVNKSIRDMCVFALHNFLKDPPFGKMDCISCRNVLIYMEPYLQKKALSTFHYALNPKGFLLLGKSETTAGMPDLFGSLGKTDKLFTRKDVPGRFVQVTSQRSEQIISRANNHSKIEAVRNDFQKTADDILLTRYTPAGVVVNEAMDIVHFRGNTGNYLEQAPGKPSHNLMMMAKHGLAFELRNILHKAKTEKKSVVKENIPLQINGSLRNISIEAIELPKTLEPYFLVLFHDNNLNDADGSAISSKRKTSSKTKKDEKDIRIQMLEQELAQAREDMRSITEDQEAVNEELQSANEELLSGSEELQSLNEELETSKEELQSTNEELIVLNSELLSLNEQVTRSRNYAESILATLYHPLLVLDKNLRVKTANKAFYKTFKVNELETEDVLVYDLGNRQWNIPELRTLLEEILPHKSEITDYEVRHKFTSIGERVIVLNAIEILRDRKEEKLILLSIEDITERKEAGKKIEENEKQLQNIFSDAPACICILEGIEHKYILANKDYEKLTNRKAKDLLGQNLREVFPELIGTGAIEIYDKVFETGEPFTAPEYAVTVDLKNEGVLKQYYFNFSIEPLKNDSGKIYAVMSMSYNVTEQVEARRKIEESEKRYNLMLMKSPFAFAVLKGKNMVITLANDSVKEIWGKGKDIEGKPLLEVLPELKDSQFPGLLDNVYTTGAPFYGAELPAPIMRNGKLEDVYFNFVYQPYLEADETISGITIIGSEVTEQVIAKRKIIESELRFSNLIYTSPSAIGILLGEDLVITTANEPIIEIWGKGKEIIGRKYFEALPELAEQGYKEVFNQVYKTGMPFTAIETPVSILQNGETTLKYYNFILYPQKNINGEINGIGIIATEVTSQAKYNLQIKESEERFRLLVMQAPVAIFVLRGEDFIIETMNQEMANFWDRKIEDSLNKPLLDVITEVKDQVYKELLDNVYRTGNRFVSQELPLAINRNGKLEDVFVKFVYEPLREADGTVTGVMVLADEITDQVNARKKIEVSEKKFRLLTNAMPQKITNADKDGNVTFFNQQWLDDTGLTFEELRDWGWEKAMHPDDLELTINNWKHSIATGEMFDMECRIQNKEGGFRWHLSRAVPIKDETGNIIMWVGSNTDIHELKEAKSKAEAAMNAKQQFLSNMSHEIRTPMNAIVGFTNVVLKTNLDEAQKGYIDAIKVSGNALLLLINDILDLAKVDSGKLTFERSPFNLVNSISAMLQVFELKIKEKSLGLNLHLDPKLPQFLVGDAIRLRQIILNLMSNAVKFTDTGSISLNVSLLNEDNDKLEVEFEITDTGIGISKDKLEQVFNNFEQAHNNISFGGTGLGLAIAKQLVEQQGGTITVKSEEGVGSTFSFKLSFGKSDFTDLAVTEKNDSNSEPQIKPAEKQIKVLVAEDVELNQMLIKIILFDFGFEVEIAEHGKQAIEKLQSQPFDIVLMDLQMPVMDGFEATAYIRNEMKSKIPIIALTADVTTVDSEKSKNLGMDDYISKPIDEELLYSKMMKLLHIEA